MLILNIKGRRSTNSQESQNNQNVSAQMFVYITITDSYNSLWCRVKFQYKYYFENVNMSFTLPDFINRYII